MPTLYGIKNCDTVKKARKWLDERGIVYQFHDYKTAGLDAEQLIYFADKLGWQSLINRSSTSWRQLDTGQQAQLMDLQTQSGTLCADNKAVLIILNTPTLLKRPILDCAGQLLIGFNADRYQEHCL